MRGLMVGMHLKVQVGSCSVLERRTGASLLGIFGPGEELQLGAAFWRTVGVFRRKGFSCEGGRCVYFGSVCSGKEAVDGV